LTVTEKKTKSPRKRLPKLLTRSQSSALRKHRMSNATIMSMITTTEGHDHSHALPPMNEHASVRFSVEIPAGRGGG